MRLWQGEQRLRAWPVLAPRGRPSSPAPAGVAWTAGTRSAGRTSTGGRASSRRSPAAASTTVSSSNRTRASASDRPSRPARSACSARSAAGTPPAALALHLLRSPGDGLLGTRPLRLALELGDTSGGPGTVGVRAQAAQLPAGRGQFLPDRPALGPGRGELSAQLLHLALQPAQPRGGRLLQVAAGPVVVVSFHLLRNPHRGGGPAVGPEQDQAHQQLGGVHGACGAGRDLGARPAPVRGRQRAPGGRTARRRPPVPGRRGRARGRASAARRPPGRAGQGRTA